MRDWLADLLLKKLEVVPSRESSVVDISFKGADPQFVAAVSNAFAEQYQKVSIQLKVDPMRKATRPISTTRPSCCAITSKQAQSRLSKYQQDNGIVSLDNRLDVESNRLNDLSAQLVDGPGRRRWKRPRASAWRRAAMPAESPDVASNPLIQSLKLGLGNAEGKLAELGQRLDRNHPQYQSAKAEVDKLRRDLAEQTRATSQSVGNNAQILQQREGVDPRRPGRAKGQGAGTEPHAR